jgi:choline monooxygenase
MAVARTTPRLEGADLSVPADSFMDPRGYTSRRYFEVEMREVFPRTWVFVGDLGQIPNPGDYLTETVGYEPIVVLRDTDRRVRAFSNVCPHRASTLVEGEGNCGTTITCPYHGWTYQLDGRLTGISYRRDLVGEVRPDELGLREIAVGIWEQFVFVNISGKAPPLEEYLEDLPAILANHGLTDVHRIHDIDDVVDANWKVFMDNAFCDYHVPFVHRRLMPMIDKVSRFVESAGEWTTLLHTPLSDYGKSLAPPWSALVRGSKENTLAFGVFPNLLGIAFVTGDIHLLHWSPLSVDRTRSRVHAYSHTDPDPDDFRYGKASIETLQGEDYAVVESVQRGIKSALYRAGPRHYLETRLNGFQRTLMRVMGEVAADRAAARSLAGRPDLGAPGGSKAPGPGGAAGDPVADGRAASAVEPARRAPAPETDAAPELQEAGLPD